MKYIWIIMLIIIDIIWFIFSLKDFIYAAKRYRNKNILLWLKNYTISFIVLNLMASFFYSLYLFIRG